MSDYEKLARDLGIPHTRDLQALCDRMNELCPGPPIELVEVEYSPDRPCATVHRQASGRCVVEYVKHPDEQVRLHNVLHELAHIAFGDLDSSQAEMEALLSRFPDLDPDVVLAVFRRDQGSSGAFSTDAEYRAEMFASYADAMYLEAEESLSVRARTIRRVVDIATLNRRLSF
ncbi:hypothetical protein ABH935_006452 [Catenulispora sp. GAS73]|uniref:hypothetical protein n=1 Tax=Catenulispora sp. GAS73 TaxID=3156269 RepID=UPI003514D4D2